MIISLNRRHLKVPGVGDEFSVFNQDRVQRGYKGALFQERRRVPGTLKDDFKGPGTNAGRRAQNAFPLRLTALVQWKELFRGSQGWLDKMPCQRRASRESAEAIDRAAGA